MMNSKRLITRFNRSLISILNLDYERIISEIIVNLISLIRYFPIHIDFFLSNLLMDDKFKSVRTVYEYIIQVKLKLDII